MEKLTFAQYLETKDQLRKAIKETPVQEVEYAVRKYCKIPLGESKEDREYISLKPKQTVVVKWLYEDVEDPTPVGVWFTELHEGVEFSTFWSGEKLNKWLSTNAREKFNV
jgi:hypothetical protein